MRWVLLWLLVCGFSHPDQEKIKAAIAAQVKTETDTKATEVAQQGTYRQVIPDAAIPDGTAGSIQWAVDEYLGPQGPVKRWIAMLECSNP